MKPLLIGHRGSPLSHPENSMQGFLEALEYCDGIECDVTATKDKKAIVFHDTEIDRLMNGSGSTSNYTLRQLQKIGMRSDAPILTLSDFFSRLASRVRREKKTLIIELKHFGVIKELLQLIEKYKLEKNVVVITFLHPLLSYIKKKNPSIRTGAMFLCFPVHPLQLVTDCGADYMVMYTQVLAQGKRYTKKLVSDARLNGIKVIAAEVYDHTKLSRKEIVTLFKLGVDGLTLNNYKYAKELMNDSAVRSLLRAGVDNGKQLAGRLRR